MSNYKDQQLTFSLVEVDCLLQESEQPSHVLVLKKEIILICTFEQFILSGCHGDRGYSHTLIPVHAAVEGTVLSWFCQEWCIEIIQFWSRIGYHLLEK